MFKILVLKDINFIVCQTFEKFVLFKLFYYFTRQPKQYVKKCLFRLRTIYYTDYLALQSYICAEKSNFSISLFFMQQSLDLGITLHHHPPRLKAESTRETWFTAVSSDVIKWGLELSIGPLVPCHKVRFNLECRNLTAKLIFNFSSLLHKTNLISYFHL